MNTKNVAGKLIVIAVASQVVGLLSACTMTKDGVAIGGVSQSRILVEVAKIERDRESRQER